MTVEAPVVWKILPDMKESPQDRFTPAEKTGVFVQTYPLRYFDTANLKRHEKWLQSYDVQSVVNKDQHGEAQVVRFKASAGRIQLAAQQILAEDLALRQELEAYRERDRARNSKVTRWASGAVLLFFVGGFVAGSVSPVLVGVVAIIAAAMFGYGMLIGFTEKIGVRPKMLFSGFVWLDSFRAHLGLLGAVAGALRDDVRGPLRGWVDSSAPYATHRLVSLRKSSASYKPVAIYRRTYFELRCTFRDGNQLRLNIVEKARHRLTVIRPGKQSGKPKTTSGAVRSTYRVDVRLALNPKNYTAPVNDEIGQRVAAVPGVARVVKVQRVKRVVSVAAVMQGNGYPTAEQVLGVVRAVYLAQRVKAVS